MPKWVERKHRHLAFVKKVCREGWQSRQKRHSDRKGLSFCCPKRLNDLGQAAQRFPGSVPCFPMRVMEPKLSFC